MERKVEYAVRKVTRYLVTEFHEEIHYPGKELAGSCVYGEYDHLAYAGKVAEALAAADPDAKYIGVQDERE